MSVVVAERANPGYLPRTWVVTCAVLIAIGVIAFLAGLVVDANTAWLAFHVNFIYFAGLAQGGLIVACALVIVGARWAGPVRHVAEGLAAWVPISFLLLGIDFLGRNSIHANWINGAPPGKEAWLNVPRVYLTDAAVLGILALLTLRFLKASFRPSLHGVAATAPRAASRFEGWTANWRGDEAERAASDRTLRVLAPIICLLYAFGYTLVGFDQVMSLDPNWYSTIFGWYFGWAGFLNGVAATALVCVLLRRSPGWDAEITGGRLHDLGKMIFAFSIFWMYLFFAQYLVIWYGNLPEETEFIQARLGTQFLQDTWHWAWIRLNEPYVKLSLVAWAGCWIIPFWVLLGERPKRTPAILGGVAVASLLGFWLERNALIWPALMPENGMSWLGPIQIGVAAGFLGAFALVYLVFSRVFPTLPLPRR